MHRLLNKYLFLLDVGGLLYILIELIWRGRSHWTMFLLGGICFIYLGLINEVLPWSMPLWQQILIGRDYSARVLYRLHRQSLARLGCLGLQRNAWQHPRTDLPTVHAVMAASVPGRNRLG